MAPLLVHPVIEIGLYLCTSIVRDNGKQEKIHCSSLETVRVNYHLPIKIIGILAKIKGAKCIAKPLLTKLRGRGYSPGSPIGSALHAIV